MEALSQPDMKPQMKNISQPESMDFSSTPATSEADTNPSNLSTPAHVEAYFSKLLSTPTQLDAVASSNFHAMLSSVQRDEESAKRVISLLLSSTVADSIPSAIPSLMIALVAAAKKA